MAGALRIYIETDDQETGEFQSFEFDQASVAMDMIGPEDSFRVFGRLTNHTKNKTVSPRDTRRD